MVRKGKLREMIGSKITRRTVVDPAAGAVVAILEDVAVLARIAFIGRLAGDWRSAGEVDR